MTDNEKEGGGRMSDGRKAAARSRRRATEDGAPARAAAGEERLVGLVNKGSGRTVNVKPMHAAAWTAAGWERSGR